MCTTGREGTRDYRRTQPAYGRPNIASARAGACPDGGTSI